MGKNEFSEDKKLAEDGVDICFDMKNSDYKFWDTARRRSRAMGIFEFSKIVFWLQNNIKHVL